MEILLSLSAALLAGLLLSRLAKMCKLPAVTAYLIAGILVGPFVIGSLGISGLGFNSLHQVESYSLLSDIALGFIAFAIGNEFRYSQLKKIGKQATVIGIVFFLFATPLIGLFGKSPEAVASGVLRARICTPFYLFLACSHGIAAVCRGAGYSKVPMYIMLGAWCVLRVTYITIVTNLFHNISLVYAAYPMTWAVSTACFLWYYNKSQWLERVEAKYR